MFDTARSFSSDFGELEWFDFELRSPESGQDRSRSLWQKWEYEIKEVTEEWNGENQ